MTPGRGGGGVNVVSMFLLQTFSVAGGPADTIGSWYSEEWWGSEATPGVFTYESKTGALLRERLRIAGS
jgi:hypothetical protein